MTRSRFLSLFAMLSLTACVSVSCAPSFTDNFNDNSIDPSWWTPIATGGSTVVEVNNRLEMTQGPDGSAGLQFKPLLPGDFDAVVDYQLLNWPDNNQERIGIVGHSGVVIRISDNEYLPTANELYITDFRAAGDVHTLRTFFDRTATTDTSGKLKFTKQGTTISGYYWDQSKSDWSLIHSYTATSTSGEKISLALWPQSPVHPGVKAAFDNFTIRYSNSPSYRAP